jgi:hypothetical protein
MLKVIIISTIAFYVFYKITSFFFKAGAASQQLRNQQANQKFNGESRKKTEKTNIKGGEYVDYEEVK